MGVFLALGLGILVGTGFLGGALVETLEGNVNAAEAKNAENTERITQLQRTLNSDEDFAESVAPLLLGQELQNTEVMVLELEGIDGEIQDGVESMIAAAGGEVTSTIRFTNKFQLAGQAEKGSARVDRVRARDGRGRALGAHR